MTTLIKYDDAIRALTEAHSVDEVKDLRDRAMAMQVYAQQAKDRRLIEMATDIKMRAERRAGELLREIPKNKGTRGSGDANVGKSSGGNSKSPPVDTTPKLSDLGISKIESSRWQKLAAMPEKDFEEKVTGVKSAMRAKTEGPRPKKNRAHNPKPPAVQSKHNKIVTLSDAGLASREIAVEVGVGARMVDRVLEVETARREAIPEIDPATLSMSAQAKLAAAIKQHQHKLDAQFERRVLDEIRKRMDEIVLPHWRRQIEEAQHLYSRRKSFMSKETFNTIRRALHPDSRNAISDKKLGQAFDTFMGLEKYLLDEKDSPTEFGDLPSSAAEWDKMRTKRSAKRTVNSMSIRR